MSVASLAAATALSHVSVSSVDVYRAGVLVAEALPVTGGSVAVNAGAAVRRRCTLTVVDDTGTLTPAAPTDALAPYGNELVVWRGVEGNLAQLGVFRIEAARVADTGASLTVDLTGFDRAGTVQEARFEDAYTVASGTNYATAIEALVEDRYPGLSYSFVSTSRTTPLLVFEEGADPWEAAQSMAAAIGMDLFFDQTGTCVLRPEPDPVAASVAATFVEGEASVVVAVENNLTAKPAYNKFIVTGEPVDASSPVRAEALDNNPASPTYYYGPFGKRPRFYRSQFITTTAQAQETADAFLLRELGGSEQVTFTAIPNAALDAGDVVQVVRERIGVDTVAVVDELTIPLAVDALMNVTTRARRSSE